MINLYLPIWVRNFRFFFFTFSVIRKTIQSFFFFYGITFVQIHFDISQFNNCLLRIYTYRTLGRDYYVFIYLRPLQPLYNLNVIISILCNFIDIYGNNIFFRTHTEYYVNHDVTSVFLYLFSFIIHLSRWPIQSITRRSHTGIMHIPITK